MTNATPETTPRPVSWSTLHISLHWLTVVLIVWQWWTGDFMGGLVRAEERGREIDAAAIFLGYSHAAMGTLVLLSILTRLFDRFYHGRPPHPADAPNWANFLARATHFLLYAILIVMPLSGMAAFFGGIEPAEEFHEFVWTPLLGLIGLHVIGALVNHFHYRNDVLRRMMPGHGGR